MTRLYHYCSNRTLYRILKSGSLMMSDISKSNDYRELNLFFPGIFRSIIRLYDSCPFSFGFHKKKDREAMEALLKDSYFFWKKKFENGDFLNYVACFSEREDSLNQWRSYADNGRGCCAGFSKELIEEYCRNSKGVVRLEKVQYISDRELHLKIDEEAEYILEDIKERRGEGYIDDEQVIYNLNSIVEKIFIHSLVYKSDAFEEEKEWRIFLSDGAFREKNLVISGNEEKGAAGDEEYSETIKFLKDRIEITPEEDDFVTCCPVYFSEFSSNPVLEIRVGPKNIARRADLQFLIDTFHYGDCQIRFSEISYF